MNNIQLLYIDLFCGAGGTSTGVEKACYDGDKCAKVIACVNHDANAIASHAANHPEALHFTEDIRTLELTPLLEHLEKKRAEYPGVPVVLWASLECTNFSKAKGGQPRDADSRTLAEHLFRYIEAIRPDYIQIENVEEFMCWGDMDENGKPISKDRGRSYVRWVNRVRSYGYNFDYRILDAADYGAYSHRRRYFGIFAYGSLPICFPRQTHARKPSAANGNSVLFSEDSFSQWNAVGDVLDLEDVGKSIFTRKKPLVEATLQRIYAGLVKFVAGGKDAFLVKWNSMNQNGHYQAPGIDEPCPTVATQNRLGVARVQFLSKQFGGHPDSKNIPLDAPSGAITCRDHHAFITAYYGNGGCHSIDEPAPTITTHDRLAFVDLQYGNGTPASLCEPCPTITTNPKQNLVTAIPLKPWVMNPQFSSSGGSIDKPCFTLIARTDKRPPYLMTPVVQENTSFASFSPSDTPTMRKIKEFMKLYGIADIYMRMFKISEMKRIMGFPEDYILVGTQSEQKKFIGNAVEVNMARVLCEAIVSKLVEMKKSVA